MSTMAAPSMPSTRESAGGISSSSSTPTETPGTAGQNSTGPGPTPAALSMEHSHGIPDGPMLTAGPSTSSTPRSAAAAGSLKHEEKVTSRGPPPSREELNRRAQRLINEINEKRKRDTTLLDDFRKALQDRVAMSCSAVEERMYSMYDTSGKDIQRKLQEFFATLDRVESIEEELCHFRQGLGALYTDMQQAGGVAKQGLAPSEQVPAEY